MHRRWRLQIELCELLGVSKNSVEVLQPSKFRDKHRGTGLILNFWVVTTSFNEEQLEDMMKNDFMKEDTKQLQGTIPASQLETIRRQGNCPFARAVYSAWNRSLRKELGCIDAFDFEWANKYGDPSAQKGLIAMTSQSPRSNTGRTDSTTPFTGGDTLAGTTNGTGTTSRSGMNLEGNEGKGANGQGGNALVPRQTQLQMGVASGSTASLSGYDSGGDEVNIPVSNYKQFKPAAHDDAMSKLERDAMDIQIND